MVLATPILRDGRLVAFVALTASHPGLGRATLAPVDRLRREGLILPWLRVGHLGRVQDETVTLLAANTDDPTEFREDLAVTLHALGLGRDALEEALERFGDDGLRALGGGGLRCAACAAADLREAGDRRDRRARGALRRPHPPRWAAPRVRIEALAESRNPA